MLSLLASQLLLVVSHDAAARGQLRLLERYADRIELAVSLGAGNALSDSALEALRRWPALVAVELVPPLVERDAEKLRQLPRLAVRLPARAQNEPLFIPLRQARKEEPSLALLGPSLVRVERASPAALAPGPCPASGERVLPDGALELRLEGPVSQCELEWLHARLDPHAEGAGELPPEMQALPPPVPDAPAPRTGPSAPRR